MHSFFHVMASCTHALEYYVILKIGIVPLSFFVCQKYFKYSLRTYWKQVAICFEIASNHEATVLTLFAQACIKQIYLNAPVLSGARLDGR